MPGMLPGLAGIIRRPNGNALPVLGCSDIDGQAMLHLQGSVDFWATPRELQKKGYRLMSAKPCVWDVWRIGLSETKHTRTLAAI